MEAESWERNSVRGREELKNRALESFDILVPPTNQRGALR